MGISILGARREGVLAQASSEKHYREAFTPLSGSTQSCARFQLHPIFFLLSE